MHMECMIRSDGNENSFVGVVQECTRVDCYPIYIYIYIPQIVTGYDCKLRSVAYSCQQRIFLLVFFNQIIQKVCMDSATHVKYQMGSGVREFGVVYVDRNKGFCFGFFFALFLSSFTIRMQLLDVFLW
eukprot:TRINITY_DN4983_c0_g1_i2.p3 TRINITY_DN4983_c0_g1~~TRINITY_DN4983_c0_g1_i2.p3  ORF type:complete len:128 (-),score=2.74 TRINITY_DN4983_c0_g1_i2:23-406(-)